MDSKSEDAAAQSSDADSQQIERCCHPDLEIRPPSKSAVLPQKKYKEWASNTNWDGARGKFALLVNLRHFIIKTVIQRFPCITNSDQKRIKDRVNEFLRSPKNNVGHKLLHKTNAGDNI